MEQFVLGDFLAITECQVAVKRTELQDQVTLLLVSLAANDLNRDVVDSQLDADFVTLMPLENGKRFVGDQRDNDALFLDAGPQEFPLAGRPWFE